MSKNIVEYSIMLISLSFLLGLIVSNTIPLTVADETQQPTSVFRTPERISPSDWIAESQVHILRDRIVINLKNATWAKFTDTNSMDPLFDINSNTLEITPQDPSDLQVGDIISYKSRITGTTIIHRIVNINEDRDGLYFVAKGDNNIYNDPERIRFEQIKGVVVGIIY
ncbi:signal peptidase I [Candidatus Woesearchaeota archaeon]|nr:signal peptidase I [Candidatus Woesearchaeota archaeon]